MTTTSASAIDFSKILVATDFSDTSDNALAYAKAFARTFGSELLLVHVADPIAHITVPEAAWADPARIQCELEATRDAGAALRAEGFKVEELCPFGGVAEEITEAADHDHAKLIIAGTNCRKGLNRLLYGSGAESILKASKLPVLIVGPKAAFAPEAKIAFRFILCAVNLDKHGAGVAALARRFADEQASDFQTVSFPFYEVTQEADGYSAFKEQLQKLLSSDSSKKISPVVLSEPPAQTLTELAMARAADLIIFDQRGSFLSPHLRGGMLTDVLATAPCPVLAVPDMK
jgi:nucleotide-binding universal stress UspA family protein